MRKNYEYGRKRKYKRGDVVVWRGKQACIGVIKSKAPDDGLNKDCWVISKSHNSLHYSNLRYATREEILRLGKNDQINISRKEAYSTATTSN